MKGPIDIGCPEDCRYRSMNLETGKLEYCEYDFKEPCKYFTKFVLEMSK